MLDIFHYSGRRYNNQNALVPKFYNTNNIGYYTATYSNQPLLTTTLVRSGGGCYNRRPQRVSVQSIALKIFTLSKQLYYIEGSENSFLIEKVIYYIGVRLYKYKLNKSVRIHIWFIKKLSFLGSPNSLFSRLFNVKKTWTESGDFAKVLVDPEAHFRRIT